MCQIADIDVVKKLMEEALKARENAYVPYSHYQVGAALDRKSVV